MKSNIGNGMSAATGAKPAKVAPVLLGRCECGGSTRVDGRGALACSKCGKAVARA